MKAEQEVFANGIAHDVWRNWWMADTTKRHDAAGTYPDGTTAYAIGDADQYYNQIDGIWKGLIDDAVAHASATDNDVRRVTIANGAVAMVDTITLTGTSGTATITLKGKAYTATFDTTLTATATAFAAANLSELSQRRIDVTSSTVDLIFTSSIAGVSIGTTSIANATGDLDGTLANTTANTAQAALTTDEAQDTFKEMFRNAHKGLRKVPKAQMRYYATRSMIENYEDTLTADTLESARSAIIDGVKRWMYNGVPILEMDIDDEIADDFEGAYPHRAILSTPQNLALVISTGNNFAETKFWFNPDENENRQRAQFEFGADFIIPEAVIVAY